MARKFASAAIAVAFVTFALVTGVFAQSFPTRPVTLVVPWPAGGSTDIGLRALATASEKHLGQPIVVENRPGAGGTIGVTHMATTAAPDGYTVAQVAITLFRLPFTTKTTFDPVRDLSHVIGVSGYTFGVVVRSDAPWQTFQDLLAHAKASPGTINYGTPGAGTSLHITMEQIAKARGITWTHVPFKGNAEAMNALLGGHVQVVADSTGWGPLVNAGKFRLLVTWGASRTKNWPSVPTLREVGIDMVSNSPFGIAGPKGMDPAVVKVLHDAFRKGMEDPSHLEAMAKLDQELAYLSSADYRAYAVRELAEQKKMIEALGLGVKE
jgi:tripartite-type tricarboxylate transporter receptor subunit TctC